MDTKKKRKTEKKQLSPLETAAAMLSRRPLSRLELKRKLHEKELSWKTAEETVQECERLGFVNDAETSESYVRSMRNSGDGSRKIRMKLRMRGFRKDDVEQAFIREESSSGRTEKEIALNVLNSRRRTLEREPDFLKRKTKALRILASKGFAPDAAFQALDLFFGRPDRFSLEDDMPPDETSIDSL